MPRWTRAAAVALVTGMLLVSAAWAGAVLAPVGLRDAVSEVTDLAERLVPKPPAAAPEEPATAPSTTADEVAAQAAPASLGAGQVLAGAAKVSMEPRPDDFGGTWQTENCETLGSDIGEETLTHLLDLSRTLWPAPANCIFMGGYGIGPMNAISSWDDEHGLWVRSIALGDGEETVVLVLIDAVYYFAEYASMCAECGAVQIAERLGAELGIDPAGFFIAATHAHTAPDLVGGWGGVPDWYMQQVEQAIEQSIREAYAAREPAVLEIGEEWARPHNRERRNTYRSAEEPGMSWFRVVAAPDEPARPGRRPRQPATPRVIATVGAFAAHPTTVSPSGVAHADWPGVFASEVEGRFGGVAANFPTGLGNMSASGGTRMGELLARLLPDVGQGQIVEEPDIAVGASQWRHPVTNSGLTVLGLPRFFDRPFDVQPATVQVGTHDARPCLSAAPVSVLTGVNAARIGPLLLTGAPGELFSNVSNTIKEANPHGITLPFGMTNDGLGYIAQSFESDFLARQGLGFFAQDAGFEYEDAYSIDHCIGDKVLEETLQLVRSLG
jgi:hypothetical protein